MRASDSLHHVYCRSSHPSIILAACHLSCMSNKLIVEIKHCKLQGRHNKTVNHHMIDESTTRVSDPRRLSSYNTYIHIYILTHIYSIIYYIITMLYWERVGGGVIYPDCCTLLLTFYYCMCFHSGAFIICYLYCLLCVICMVLAPVT
jgi:hypothetical protein